MKGNMAPNWQTRLLSPYIQSSTISKRLHIYVTNFCLNSYSRRTPAAGINKKGILVKDPFFIQKPCHGMIFN